MNHEEYIVDGFIFSSHVEYVNAQDEWNTVEYIKKNSDMTNEGIVYKLFNKLNERQAFKTVIGLKFQSELRDILLKTGNYTEELKHIIVSGKKEDQSTTTVLSNSNKKTDNLALKKARIINIFLVLTILAMFIVNIYT